MKASTTTTTVSSLDRLRALERTRRRTVVSLALRDKALAANWAARLTAECDAVAFVCPIGDAVQVESWLNENRADVLLLEERWLHRLAEGTLLRMSARSPSQSVACQTERDV